MKQIQFLLFAAIGFVVFSCSAPKAEEDINKKLEKYKKEQADINNKIDQLQKQIGVSPENESRKKEVSVSIETIKPETFYHYFDASGTVLAVQEAFVSPETNGQIKDILVKEGDLVRKGQVLAKLTTELIDKSIDEVKTSLALASDIYERQQRLWDQKVGSELQYLQAKNNKASLENRLSTLKAQLDLSIIKAPIDGVVEKVNQKKGEMAAPGIQMIYVVNLNQIIVRAEVSEHYISAVRKGEKVEVKFPSYPDFTITAPINRVGNVVNKNNRTFELELKLENPNQMFKPNMIAVLNINDFTAENSIIIPSKVLKEDLKGKYVYVSKKVGDKHIASKRYVTIGRTYLGNSCIIDGLAENDSVIIDGHNRVTDGTYLSFN